MSAQAWLSREMEITVSGDIDFSVAMELDREVKLLLKNHTDGCWVLDMASVQSVNSVALSLLMNWIRCLRAQDGELKIKSIPTELMGLASVCGVDDLLNSLK